MIDTVLNSIAIANVRAYVTYVLLLGILININKGFQDVKICDSPNTLSDPRIELRVPQRRR